ncbi:Uncharacterised protein [Chryseobacterium taklimakanense]|uniref:C4-dicarboxylate ABC transporter n=1 Tax=Chryseobacterium taklimakanense TaxID=536441 RepID=A0A239XAY5_9FLAO|nr:Uncharacterised protein [Chryseobacterium taklimakanense]
MLLFFYICDMMFNWLSLVTGFFYIVMGIFVIIYKFFVITLDPTVSYLLGGLMIVYGFFRIFRAVYRLRENKNED